MTAQLRGPAYRAALSEAYRELDEICERLAELRVRKERIEKAAVALQELVSAMSAVPAQGQPAMPVHTPVYEMPSNDRRQEQVTDPLQRQINHALGMAALA
jgi:hypothetical protein